MFPALASPLSVESLTPRRGQLFELDVPALEQDVDTGELTASSGHTGTFSRGATLAGVLDSGGNSYTANYPQPAWEARDWDNDGEPESYGIRLGSSDRVVFPVEWRPQALAFLLEFWELGTISTSNADLWAVCSVAGTGASLGVYQTATGYQLAHNNGSATVTSTVTTKPVTGDRVRLRGQITASGAVQLWQSRNGAAYVAGSLSAAPSGGLGAAWAAGAAVRVGRGVKTTSGHIWVRRLVILAGTPSVARLEARR